MSGRKNNLKPWRGSAAQMRVAAKRNTGSGGKALKPFVSDTQKYREKYGSKMTADGGFYGHMDLQSNLNEYPLISTPLRGIGGEPTEDE